MSAAAASAPKSGSGSTLSVQLKRKRLAGDWDGPALVRFPAGPPAPLMSAADSGDISFKMYANPDERKHFQRILTAQTPGVVYASQNFGAAHSFRANHNTYAIGVYDPAKNKCRVVAVPHVYSMAQHVRALDALESASAAEGEESFAAKQRVLADTFGSKKTQKRLASRAANQVTLQESTSQVLTHAVSSIRPSAAEGEAELLDGIRQTVLPPYDDAAQSVRDIYPLSSLIPADLRESLAPALKQWKSLVKKGPSGVTKNARSDAPLTRSSFLQQRLGALASLEAAGDTREESLRVGAYLDLLLRFKDGGKNKRRMMEEWPEEQPVKDYLLAQFTSPMTSPDGFQRLVFDGAAEQKLHCYLAVAAVWMCNFHMNAEHIDALATDLRMMTSDMLKYFIEIGCSTSKSSIRLTAPLKLPKLRKKLDRKK